MNVELYPNMCMHILLKLTEKYEMKAFYPSISLSLRICMSLLEIHRGSLTMKSTVIDLVINSNTQLH